MWVGEDKGKKGGCTQDNGMALPPILGMRCGLEFFQLVEAAC